MLNLFKQMTQNDQFTIISEQPIFIFYYKLNIFLKIKKKQKETT